MIICVSANPALDRRLRLKSLKLGEIHRARQSVAAAGGKAAHVAMVARSLNEPVLWIGLIGGAAGEHCRREIVKLGIQTAKVETEGVTRSNLELIEEAACRNTEIREPGAPVSSGEAAAFFECCREQVRRWPRSCVVLSGSLRPGTPIDFYRRMIEESRACGSTVLLDAAGEAFSSALQAYPDVIKPNQAEASEALEHQIGTLADAISAARTLIERGARAVALSLGSQGMLWADHAFTSVLYGRSEPLQAVSTVDCGDSMLAGIAVGLSRGIRREEMVRLAVACGAANCYAEMPGMIECKRVETLMPSVVLTSCIDTA